MRDKRGPTETELKLTLKGREDDAAVVETMRSHGYDVEPLEPVVNCDLYLDTFDWLLLKKGLSLRYRVCDDEVSYTVKSIGDIKNGVAKRMEVEAALDKPLKNPGDVKVRRIRDIVGKVIYPRKLLGQVCVRTERRRYSARTPDGARLEIAFDAASFVMKGLDKTRKSGPVHEFEAELIAGGPGALDALASLLAASFAYTPSISSKFEAAVKRFKIAPPSKRQPEKYVVRAEDRLDHAMRKFLLWQSARLREELPGLRMDIDTEFVHRARVATRRMRSALMLLQEAVPAATGKFIEGELKWLSGLLGEVRDLDVFLLNLERFRKDIGRFTGKQRRVFVNLIKAERRVPLEALIKTLDSSRYRKFEQRLDRFLRGPLPRRSGIGFAQKAVAKAASALINAKLAEVMEQGRLALAGHKLKEFHLLRIRLKRLRYACEFMSTAYGGALEPFIGHMTEMQDCLGVIQDTVFMRGFIEDLFKEGRRKMASPSLVFVLGEMYQFYSGLAEDRIREFDGVWDHFASEDTLRQLKDVLGP